MKDNNWHRVEEIFHEIIGMNAEKRDAYLAQACAGDDSLRSEVESLLSAFDNHQDFLDQPALSLGLKMMSVEAKEESLEGKLIGPYKILRVLGKGGMGKVYLAEDTKLDRKVALKFLSGKLTDDAWARRQLIKEAQAVANLNHLNICIVYDLEEHDGYIFIVMQYIEGETLAALISKKLLEPKRVLRLAVQIASALAEAQAHDIVHRDIKPQNIMVTADGQAKVLDFGLAKLIQQKQGATDSESLSSRLGVVPGTVPYMSPEQLRAERLDFRSDIFSLGIVLYEMISGRNPYSRASDADTITAILTSDPPPLINIAADIPAEMARITQKCLNKNRDHRYQSASELLLELNNPQNNTWTRPHRQQYFKLPLYIAFALLMLIIGAAIIYHSNVTRVRTLAVLPVINETTDADTKALSAALNEGLTNRLSHLSRLRVKAPTVVPEYENQEVAKQKAGKDLNADSVLVERLFQQGESTFLQVALVDGTTGSPIWQEVYPLTSDMLTMQKQIADQIIFRMNISLTEYERARLYAHQTGNEEAYKNYLRGRYYWQMRDEENIKKAIYYFEQAINQDPVYGRAYAGLSDSYVLLTTVAYGTPLSTREAMTKAKFAAKKALEIDDTSCEAHTSMGTYLLKYEWNWQEAEKEFKRAIQLDPTYAPARFYYSILLTLMGHVNESIEESKAAKDLEPFSPRYDWNLACTYYFSRQYDKAADSCLKVLEKNRYHTSALNLLGYIYQQKHMTKDSMDIFKRLYDVNPIYGTAPLGFAYARAGRISEALDMLRKLSDNPKTPPQEKAIVYLGLDDKDQVFKFLQDACNERFATFPSLIIDPLLDNLRSDPRFAELLRRANLARS
ncbi:MAG: protein kinase [Blastocatellia bacterium]